MSKVKYELCKHCDHFIEINAQDIKLEDVVALTSTFITLREDGGGTFGMARYVHLDDGEKDHDHDATPSGDIRTDDEWFKQRPDLFKEHMDGKVGPNSVHHVCREIVEAPADCLPEEEHTNLKAMLESQNLDQVLNSILKIAGRQVTR